jgi:predicted GIY-YIG superfamily endonuclease
MSDETDISQRYRITDLQAELPRLPVSAGVYLMRDAAGEVIYVGKAGNLKKRLGAYVKNTGSGRKDTKTEVLIRKIAAVETIVTASEKEARPFASTPGIPIHGYRSCERLKKTGQCISDPTHRPRR